MRQSSNGTDWEEPYQVTDTVDDDIAPFLRQSEDGTIHVVWTVQKPGIYYFNVCMRLQQMGGCGKNANK
jgi:hypothetical protein